VAARLASAINYAAGDIVTASASGATINLVSTATGANTNYSVTVNVTDSMSASYPSHFSSPSFQASATSMSGGSTAVTGTGPVYTYAVPATGGYDPASNLLGYTDSVMGTWNFNYDSLNWLVSSQNTANTPPSAQFAGSYGCWSYDSFGNRLSESMSTTACANNPPLMSWAKYNANNQFTNTIQAHGGVQYDPSGDVTNDGVNQYLYDGEGRICAVAYPNGTGGSYYEQYLYDAGGSRVAKGSLQSWPSSCAAPTNGFTLTNQYLLDAAGNQATGSAAQYQYIYDAAGLRVGKASFTGSFPAANTTCAAPGAATGFTLTNQYLLNQSGNQVTELDGSGNWLHSNLWAASHLGATYDPNGLHFHLSDPLGTRRMQVNSFGAVEQSCQSLPFGDGLSCSGSITSPTEHHYTGKERDAESGNDDFGARYYSSAMARFLSPDPFLNSGRPDDPQTWNRYAYALNNPLIITDPTGLYNLQNTCHAYQPQCMMDFAKNAKQLKDGLEALNKALDDPTIANSLGVDAVGRLSQGLAAMGGENDGNNVDVKFGATDSGGAADTTRQTDAQTGSSRFTVTFDPSKTSGSIGFAINADHEGMHVYDEKNNQLTTTNHPFQFEYRGYQNSSWASQALGLQSIGARNTQIWNKSWSAVDRETLRDKGITKVVTDRLHPVEEPHNPITP
jgi:RHS repeat-associated protein